VDGSGSGLFEGTILEGLRKNTKRLRIVGAPTEMQTEHLSNAGQKRCHLIINIVGD
jgi:hypothetical protein